MVLGFSFVTSFRVEDTKSLRDVHLLMRTAYNQWKNEGTWRTIMEAVVDVLKCGVLALSIFVLGFMVNWDSVLTCSTELECQQTPVIHNPSFQTVPGAHTLLLMILFLSAIAACLYECKRCAETVYLQYELHDLLSSTIDCGPRSPFHTLRDIWFRYRASASGHEELPLGDNIPLLSDLSWSEFLHLFCSVIQKERSLAIHRQQRFDELRAIQALMVYDNYFIALHQKLLHPESSYGFSGPAISLIDQSILRFLIQSLFDSSNCLDVAVDQRRAIGEKLFGYLIAYWVFYPFFVSHALVKMVVKNVAAFRARPSEFLDRQWTEKSWWAFRLFNEVPHVTDERLVAAQTLANDMLGRIRRPSPISKFVERLAATIIVAILFLSFMNPAVLMGGIVSHRSLVWWLSTWFLVFTAFHVSELPLREYNHKKDLRSLCHLIHYETSVWQVSGSRWASSVQWDYFQSRWYVLGAALAKTLLMPLILLKLYFDDSIPLLVEVIQEHSSRVDGIGSIASDADFSHNPNLAPHPHPLRLCRPGGANSSDAPPYHGDLTYKHEKSIASFASVYPRWRRRAASGLQDSAAAELGLQEYLMMLFGEEHSTDEEDADHASDNDVYSDDASLPDDSAPPPRATGVTLSGSTRVPQLRLTEVQSVAERAAARLNSARQRTAMMFADTSGVGQSSPRSRAHEMQHRIVSRVDMLSATMMHLPPSANQRNSQRGGGLVASRNGGGGYGAASVRREVDEDEVEMTRAINMPADGLESSQNASSDDNDDDHRDGGRGRRNNARQQRR
ncbi:autophagy protein-like, putative [Bodo saltans]|uniref:Autophagy-related protein 9 n=1 Tax=Bodo saltans TaxID=75058 RepID=A0A0S4JRE4_BODSA|nr:autophagy protein-like, putative [Bodo saltans]|eukprot:CUG94089.1 autophagy protein-like, putative [Bodo saltans]